MSMIQVAWQFLEEGSPAHEQFFHDLPPGVAGDPRYKPVFLIEESPEGAETVADAVSRVPLKDWPEEWIQVGWQRVDTGELIPFKAGVAGDPSLRKVHLRVESPSS
jgi:hypothetical protein